MRSAAIAVAMVFFGTISGGTAAWAQVGSGVCPSQGTVIRLRVNGVADRTTTWLGPDRKDPMICWSADQSGRRFWAIAGYYSTSVRGGRQAVETGMRALLSGQVSEVSFDTSELVNRWSEQTWHETWKRLGTEVLEVNGKQLPTVRYRRTSEGTTANGFAGQWDLLYDPAHHAFVRSNLTLIRGYSVSPTNYDLVSITRAGK